jgi:hypothetical protein
LYQSKHLGNISAGSIGRERCSFLLLMLNVTIAVAGFENRGQMLEDQIYTRINPVLVCPASIMRLMFLKVAGQQSRSHHRTYAIRAGQLLGGLAALYLFSFLPITFTSNSKRSLCPKYHRRHYAPRFVNHPNVAQRQYCFYFLLPGPTLVVSRLDKKAWLTITSGLRDKLRFLGFPWL